MRRLKVAHPSVVPDEEQLSPDERWCPPHDFQATWATPADGSEETVPAALCAYCGEIRSLRIPGDPPTEA